MDENTPDLKATVRADTPPRVPWGAVRALPTIPGYEVLELVGRGGMGRVYRARHLGLGRIVALKLLAHEADAHLLRRFREEARAVARLQHPNIAQLYEAGSADGCPYFAQEFLDGGSLSQALAGRPQPPRDAAALVETVARAVHHSHTEGILHRDLKPGNILLARKHEIQSSKSDKGESDSVLKFEFRISDFIPKVADFGLAKTIEVHAAETKASAAGTLTRPGEILGTPSYMPPEQASGATTNIGPTVDVYALGAVLYELLTGRPPFQAPDPVQTLMMVLNREPIPPRALQPAVPRDLETICLKCLEKSPTKRYESARELADDLRRFLDGQPIVARPVGPVERAAKWARRNRAGAALIAVSAIAAVLLLASGVALGVGYFRLKAALGEAETANQNLETKNAELEQANTAIRDEKERTDREKNLKERTLTVTLVSLDRSFFDLSDQLKDLPGSELIRLDVLRRARRTLDGLAEFLADDPQILNFRMTGYDKLGNLESALGALVAEESYTKTRDIAVQLEGRFPGNPLYPQNRAIATAQLAALHLRQGDYKIADEMLDTVVPVAAEQLAAHPNDVRALELESIVRLYLYERELRFERWQNTERLMRERCALYSRLALADPNNPARTRDVIDGDRELAALLMSFNKTDEAGTILLRAAAAADALPDPASPPVRRLRAAVHSALGGYHDSRKQYPRAIAEYTTALDEYEWLARRFENFPQYRYQQATVLYYLAISTALSGDTKAAAQHLEKSEQLLAELTRTSKTNVQYRTMHDKVSELLNKIRTPPKDKKP